MKCDYCSEDIVWGREEGIFFDWGCFFCCESCAYGWRNEYYANTVDTRSDKMIDIIVESITTG